MLSNVMGVGRGGVYGAADAIAVKIKTFHSYAIAAYMNFLNQA